MKRLQTVANGFKSHLPKSSMNKKVHIETPVLAKMWMAFNLVRNSALLPLTRRTFRSKISHVTSVKEFEKS